MAAGTTKILLLSANPNDTNQLRLNEEFREIREGLSVSGNSNLFEVRQGGATRTKDLRRLILSYQPHIIHFSGHASEEGIFLETDSGHYTAVTGQTLANLFSLFSDTVNCVILNSCYSNAQATEIVKQIPYVIGMNAAIKDNAAIQFSMGFYDALGAGRTIEDAYKFGCNAIQLENNHDEVTNRGVVLPTNDHEATTSNAIDESHKPVLLIKATEIATDVTHADTNTNTHENDEIITPMRRVEQAEKKPTETKTAQQKTLTNKLSWLLIGLLAMILGGIAFFYEDNEPKRKTNQRPTHHSISEGQQDMPYFEDSKAPSPPRKDRLETEHRRPRMAEGQPPPRNREKPEERNHN